nr:E3 ubiquitin-protein ligase RNF187 [Loxodonta africana]
MQKDEEEGTHRCLPYTRALYPDGTSGRRGAGSGLQGRVPGVQSRGRTGSRRAGGQRRGGPGGAQRGFASPAPAQAALRHGVRTGSSGFSYGKNPGPCRVSEGDVGWRGLPDSSSEAHRCQDPAVTPHRSSLGGSAEAILRRAAAGSARDAPASEAALQLLCRADGGPLCRACRMAAAPEPPEWEPRWRKALRGKENKGSVEIMRKDLKDARDLHGQAESAAAVWKGHVMDRRKKALTDYKKLRAFFAEEEEHFLQEAEKAEEVPDDEGADSVERFRTLLQAVSELEKKHRNLGLSMLLQ